MSKGCGIVEYANRDQAAAAINTLSNQNLMGRLIYVREVSTASNHCMQHALLIIHRTVKPSHASMRQVLGLVAQACKVEGLVARVAATAAATAEAWAWAWVAVELAARSTLPT